MRFTDLFIRRPVLAIVVNLLVVIAGVQAIRALNVRQYPRSENAAITVTTGYVGATADLVRGFVTTPLERVIAAADGIEYIESESKQNSSVIRARLRLNYDSTKALAEISSKVDQVRRDLPPEAEIPALNIESADSQFAAAYLSFSSQFLKQNEITDYLFRVVQPRLSAIEGVQRADILGARTFAMRIWLKPDRMAALNISPGQIRTALAANNYLAAVGQTKGQLVQVNLTANTDLRSPQEFEQMVIRQNEGSTVHLRDVADVVLGAEDYETAVNFNGQTAVFIGVWPLPNANSLDVVKRLRAEMDSLQKEIPEQIQAARQGARELVGPIISMAITLAAVNTPIAFQGGLTGSLFREFALTLAGAVTISGVVALTLSPVMSGYLLDRSTEEKGLAGLINRTFERFKAAYGRSLETTFAARGAIYLAWVLIGAAAVGMFMLAPKELAPTEDQGFFFGVVNTPANSTLDQVVQSTREINAQLSEIPETDFTFQITYPTGGFYGAVLKPWEERKRAVFKILPEVSMKVAAIPGVQTFVTVPSALPGGSNFPVEFLIASTAEPDEILQFAQQLQMKAAHSGMFAFPPLIDTKIDQPQSEIRIDRDKAAELGLNLQSVGQDLAAAVCGNFVNRFSVAGRSYKVIPQLLRVERLNPEQLRDVHVTGPSGQLVSLSTIATLHDSVTPRALERFQQLNAVKLSGVAMRPLDESLRYLESEAAKILPKGYTVDYTGESRQLRTEGNKFLPAFLLAIILIFLVLAAQFNSFRDPFVILAGSVPLAMFGALLMTFLKMPNPNLHFFTDGGTTTLNVYSQVRLGTLVGLVSKDGILIVEFANKLQEEGQSKIEAVKNAALTRLRPVLMTSVATVCGHFPLTLVSGPGAAARNSIGLVLVAGMAIGTAFTLFFVPAIYLLIARDHRAEAAKAPAEVAPAMEPSA